MHASMLCTLGNDCRVVRDRIRLSCVFWAYMRLGGYESGLPGLRDEEKNTGKEAEKEKSRAERLMDCSV